MAARPNLLIAGTQKGGTTWLHRQLARHPDVHMAPAKELNFFNRADKLSSDAAWAMYLTQFEAGQGKRWRGESTPHYFWHGDDASPFSVPKSHDVAAAVRDRLGDDLTVLVSLRDPVSRAVAAYWHHFSQGRFDLPTSLFQLPAQWGLVDLGFYRRHWEHWEKTLGATRIHLLLYDDLAADPRDYLIQALHAIGAEDSPEYWPNVNLTGRENYRPWIDVFKRERMPIKPMEIAALHELYRDEITFVEGLTGRKLPSWGNLDALIAKHCGLADRSSRV